FVLLGENPFREASHGTMVLSCIASYVPGELVGSAPFVAAYVAKTEDGRSENKIEEDNWVAGIEWADSLGCQVLNSSLGYTKFDDSLQTRTYEDLNGKTSRASRAATIAASKGMIVCNSAGNEGTKKWKYIGAPADAEQILSVGAVDINGKRASFSSYGPTADGRIKPDACAVGKNTFVATPRSKTLKSNGTSFSSPILSGMVVCLWQAFPEKSNLEIIDAIRKSGSQIMAPDSSLGYGITDFLRAYNYLNLKENVKNLADFQSFVSHNGKTNIAITTETPTPLTITAKSRKSGKITTKTYDISGKKIINFTLPKLPKNTAYDIIDLTISTPTQSQNYVVGAEQTK
ncbi:MAG: S8 family serine peptidase, partial [Bacteroidales bacterium]